MNAPRLNPSQTGRYSIYLPRRDGRVSSRWCLLYTEIICHLLVCLQTVTHPSVNHLILDGKSNLRPGDHKSNALIVIHCPSTWHWQVACAFLKVWDEKLFRFRRYSWYCRVCVCIGVTSCWRMDRCSGCPVSDLAMTWSDKRWHKFWSGISHSRDGDLVVQSASSSSATAGSCGCCADRPLAPFHQITRQYFIYLHYVPKNILDIFGCNLKTNYQILIILVRIFLTQPDIKWPFSFPPHPMYAFAHYLGNADQAKYVLK